MMVVAAVIGDRDTKPAPLPKDPSPSAADIALYKKAFFKWKHRNIKKSWEISRNFPDESVIRAYRTPLVDPSDEPFEWGRPDFPALAQLCQTKFGWDEKKTQQTLEPIIKACDDRFAQARLDWYFPVTGRAANIASERILHAVRGLVTEETEVTSSASVTVRAAVPRKRKLPAASELSVATADSSSQLVDQSVPALQHSVSAPVVLNSSTRASTQSDSDTAGPQLARKRARSGPLAKPSTKRRADAVDVQDASEHAGLSDAQDPSLSSSTSVPNGSSVVGQGQVVSESVTTPKRKRLRSVV